MVTKETPIKIQIVKTLSNLQPSRVVVVKGDNESKFSLYVTDKNGIPYPIDNSPDLTDFIKDIKNTDGNLVITGFATKTINVSPALLSIINSAIQPGGNVSDLTNDAGYLTEEVDPIFQASEASLFESGDKANLDNQSGINTGDETKTSIQSKRTLKTVNGDSLEGVGNVQISYDDLSDKPTSFPPSAHTHNIPEVLGLQVLLDSKEDKINKSTNVSLGTSDELFPTQNAVKTYVDGKIPVDYSKVVYVNSTGPSTATIFDLNNPPTTNDNSLKTDVNNLYIGSDASTWVYKTSPAGYVTKTITTSISNFYLSGTTTDAGGNKNSDVERTGKIKSDGFKVDGPVGILKSDGTVDTTVYERIVNKNTPNGYVGLDGSGKILATQLPATKVKNASNVEQFSYFLDQGYQITGAGDASVSFDSTNKRIIITSIPGAGGGGAVTSFNGRTGGISPEEGDYSLNLLGDVTITSPLNNNVLFYNSSNTQWENRVLNTSVVPELTNLYYTNARGIGSVITGFVPSPATVLPTDTLLQAVNKLDGNNSLKVNKSGIENSLPILDPTGNNLGAIETNDDHVSLKGITGVLIDAPSAVVNSLAGFTDYLVGVGLDGQLIPVKRDAGLYAPTATNATVQNLVANTPTKMLAIITTTQSMTSPTLQWSVNFTNSSNQTSTVRIKLGINNVATGTGILYTVPKQTTLVITGASPYAPTIPSGTEVSAFIESSTVASVNSVTIKLDSGVSTLQLKTVEGQSLFGTGNIDLTKSDVGLSNVDNTSDLLKPISTATQAALDSKQPNLVSGTNIKTVENLSLIGPGNIDITKSMVDLDQVDNTSDVNKPISTATASALSNKEDKNQKGIANGYAPLDSNNKVPLIHINDSLIGNVNFQGLWNPSTNVPNLTVISPKGHYYICTADGNRFGIDFKTGDWVISDGTSWSKVDNTDAVSSVFGRTGNVVAQLGDYTTAQVTENTNLYYTEARVNANSNVSANTAARHNAVTLGTANGLSLSTQQLSLALASTSTTGALSSTDWNTFNGKQNALTNPVTGTGTVNRLAKFTAGGVIGNSQILDNGTTISIQTSEARLYGGDNAGRFILGNPTQTSYIEFGGSTYTTPNEVNLITTTGNLNFFTNAISRIKVVTAGRVLFGTTTDNGVDLGQFNGSVIATGYKIPSGLATQALSANGSTIDLSSNVTGTGVAGQVSFWNGTNVQSGDNQLFWDSTNKRLGLGTTVPLDKFHIENGSFRIQSGGVLSTFAHGGSVAFYGTASAHPLALTTNGIERARLTSAGRWLFGTTTDNGLDLVQVNGSAIATGYKIPSGLATQALSANGSTIDLSSNVTGTGVAGQVSFWNGTNVQSGDNGLFWDNANKRLGLGLTPATGKLLIDTSTFSSINTTTQPVRSLAFGNSSGLNFNPTIVAKTDFEGAFVVSSMVNNTNTNDADVFNTISQNTSSTTDLTTQANNRGGFSWKNGATNLMRLSRAGNLILNSSTSNLVDNGRKLQVTGVSYFNGNTLFGTTTDNLTDLVQINGSAIANAWKVTGGLVTQYQTGTGTLVDFNTSVRGATLTGYVSGAGTVAATDTVLQAINKLDGNDALKAPLASPALTGVPTAPTATAGTNTTQVATTAFVLANSTNISHLEFNNTDKTVWNNGKGDFGNNTSFGQNALKSAVSGNNFNSVYGTSAAANLAIGTQNVLVGSNSFLNATTLNSTTAIGSNAGTIFGSSGGNVLSNTSGVYIGQDSRPFLDNTTNEIVIGANAIGAGSNTATLGSSSITSTILRGNVTTNGNVTATAHNLSALNTAPASATATGTTGEIRVTATHIYVCTATNTWVRTALTTW
jgi:hypothetical protein